MENYQYREDTYFHCTTYNQNAKKNPGNRVFPNFLKNQENFGFSAFLTPNQKTGWWKSTQTFVFVRRITSRCHKRSKRRNTYPKMSIFEKHIFAFWARGSIFKIFFGSRFRIYRANAVHRCPWVMKLSKYEPFDTNLKFQAKFIKIHPLAHFLRFWVPQGVKKCYESHFHVCK